MSTDDDLRKSNPVSDVEGEAWAGSQAGERTHASIVERIGSTATPPATTGSPRLIPRLIAASAALALVVTTIVVLGGERSSPVAAGCPVTAPGAQAFSPPEGYPAEPTIGPDAMWFGSAGLWTVVEVDGGYDPKKSPWWSVDFPGGTVEEQPPLTVTAIQLDGEGTISPEHPSTNAYTAEDGWFMLADFPIELAEGCWEITGEYKGTTTSFVVEVVGADEACAVTTVEEPDFVPPAPYPATPPDLYQAHWYGTEDLWTMIPIDGASIHYRGEKLFFWSKDYVWGETEGFETPALTVTVTRLDVESDPIVVTDATNGTRTDIGGFMLTGVELPTANGCWEVRAEYQGAELTYVARVTTG